MISRVIVLIRRRLFAKGARNLELDQLREICGDYQHLNYAKGAVELPLSCAQAWDSDRQGQEYWHAGCSSQDERARFWQRRKHCYDLILDSLSVFEERCQKAKPPAKQPLVPASEGPETVRSHAYELAFSSEDEMFHSTLYDWLIERGMADELLEVLQVSRINDILLTCTVHLDEAYLPRGAFTARTRHCPEVPTLMAILRQRWTTITCCGGAICFGRIHRVRRYFTLNRQ